MGHDSWEGFVATIVVASPNFNHVFGRLYCCISMSMNFVLVARFANLAKL